MKNLMTYDDNSMLDLLTNTSNVNSFAKAVGDFTSELARPIIDHKKNRCYGNNCYCQE